VIRVNLDRSDLDAKKGIAFWCELMNVAQDKLVLSGLRRSNHVVEGLC